MTRAPDIARAAPYEVPSRGSQMFNSPEPEQRGGDVGF